MNPSKYQLKGIIFGEEDEVEIFRHPENQFDLYPSAEENSDEERNVPTLRRPLLIDEEIQLAEQIQENLQLEPANQIEEIAEAVVQVVENNEESRPIRPIKTVGTAFGGLKPIPFDQELDPEPNACFRCRVQNHDALTCYRPKTHSWCFNCGRKDRRVYTCERCSEAYKIFQAEKDRVRDQGEPVVPPQQPVVQVQPQVERPNNLEVAIPDRGVAARGNGAENRGRSLTILQYFEYLKKLAPEAQKLVVEAYAAKNPKAEEMLIRFKDLIHEAQIMMVDIIRESRSSRAQLREIQNE